MMKHSYNLDQYWFAQKKIQIIGSIKILQTAFQLRFVVIFWAIQHIYLSVVSIQMKIISEFYLITLTIILLGIPISVYIKITEPAIYTYNIVIYGDTIDTAMLAYHLDQQIQKQFTSKDRLINFNITLASSSEMKSEKEVYREMSKRLYSFCGVEHQWMSLIEKTNLKYSVNQYGVYFGVNVEETDGDQFKIYSSQSNLIKSIKDFGLSNYAARNFFLQFSKQLGKTTAKNTIKMEELTTSNIIKSFFHCSIEEQSLKFFSQKLGLDQSYVNNFITPVIRGNYLSQTNSFSAFYKLLPLYCHNDPSIGKSLAIFLENQLIKQKLLSSIKVAKINILQDHNLQPYSIIKNQQQDIKEAKKYVNVVLSSKKNEQTNKQSVNNTILTYIKSDILFIFDDYDTVSGTKQIYYYKTIIDGKIKNDEKYQKYFTIYLNFKQKKQQYKQKDLKLLGKSSANPIYSITRVCAFNCKGFENSVYILISKHRLANSKHLQMFEFHQIKAAKKIALQKSQMPTNKKLLENENVYKLYDIQSISDSFQFQLNLVKKISESLIEKIKREEVY